MPAQRTAKGMSFHAVYNLSYLFTCLYVIFFFLFCLFSVSSLCLFVSLLRRLRYNVTEKKQLSYRHETLRIDGQWLWDLAVKFARWQHPAVGCGARFAVSDITCCEL